MPKSDSRGNPARYSLMRKDVEIALFSWQPVENRVCGHVKVLHASDAPLGCVAPDGAITRSRLQRWLKRRSIPALRPGARKSLEAVGVNSQTELLARALGLSLSDQYWIRPAGSGLDWGSVNFFDHGFPDLLGELLLPSGRSSRREVEDLAASSPQLLGMSPDSALNGNLPKRWRAVGRERLLVKGGHPENRYQEPFNELIATRLCERILESGDYVPYRLEDNGYLKYASVCPCMVDASTELVPAIALHESMSRPNHESLHDFYLRASLQLGADVALSVEKMLVVDYLMVNFDRHWNNFGLLVDSDSRRAICAAPIFDTGSSLWCDRDLSQGFGCYKFKPHQAPKPFLRDVDAQLDRFTSELRWLDPSALDGFAEEACGILEGNPLVANEPGRLEALERAIKIRVGRIKEKTSRSQPIIPTTAALREILSGRSRDKEPDLTCGSSSRTRAVQH